MAIKMMLLAASLVLVALLDGSIGDKGTEKSSILTPETKITNISEHMNHNGFISNHRIWETNVVGVHSITSTSTKPITHDRSYSLEINGKQTSTDLDNAMTADHAQNSSFSESMLDSIGGNITKIIIPDNIPRIMEISSAKNRSLERNYGNTIKRSFWDFVKDTVSKVIVPARNESVVKRTNHSIVNDIVDSASAIVKSNIAKLDTLSNITRTLGVGGTNTNAVGSKNSSSFWKSLGHSISHIVVPFGNSSLMNMDNTNNSTMNAIVDRATGILKDDLARGTFLNNVTRMLGIVNANASFVGINNTHTNSTSFWKSMLDSYSKDLVPTWKEMAGLNRSIRNVIVDGAPHIMKIDSPKAFNSDSMLLSGGADTGVMKKKLDGASELRIEHVRTTIYEYLKDNIPSTSAKKGNINSTKNKMVNQIVDGIADVMKFNITEINLFRPYVESLVDRVPEFDAHDPVQFATSKHKIVQRIVQGISEIVLIDIMESVLFTSYLESLVDEISKHFDDDKTTKRGLMGAHSEVATNGSHSDDGGSLTPQASMLKMNYCDSINGSRAANCTTGPTKHGRSMSSPLYIFFCFALVWVLCCLVAAGFRVLRGCLDYIDYLFSN